MVSTLRCEAIKLLIKAREIVRTRWSKGSWCNYEQKGDSLEHEARYCALGAIGHANGFPDYTLSTGVHTLLYENPELKEALSYGFTDTNVCLTVPEVQSRVIQFNDRIANQGTLDDAFHKAILFLNDKDKKEKEVT